MPTEIIESDPKLSIIKHGNKGTGLFFLLLGLMFQVLFIWGLLSFADQSGIWALFTVTLIQSELFPYLSIVFMFGGGCLLIVVRELGWKETITVENSGIGRILLSTQFFGWQRETMISKNQIQTIRIHTIPLDRLGMTNRYQLEIDYWITNESDSTTFLIFVDKEGRDKSMVTRLASKVQTLLGEGIELEELTATPPIIDE